MADLATLNPLRRLARSAPFSRDIDDFFKGFFLTPMSLNSQVAGQFPVDVTEDVEAAKTTAKYENGVLTLVLPKKGNGNQKKIAVA